MRISQVPGDDDESLAFFRANARFAAQTTVSSRGRRFRARARALSLSLQRISRTRQTRESLHGARPRTRARTRTVESTLVYACGGFFFDVRLNVCVPLKSDQISRDDPKKRRWKRAPLSRDENPAGGARRSRVPQPGARPARLGAARGGQSGRDGHVGALGGPARRVREPRLFFLSQKSFFKNGCCLQVFTNRGRTAARVGRVDSAVRGRRAVETADGRAGAFAASRRRGSLIEDLKFGF